MAKKKSASLRPLGDKVLIRRLDAEEKTRGGIVIPDTAKEKPREGRVIALGEGGILDNGKRGTFQVKEGDRIIFTSYAGTDVKIGGVEYAIMTEEEILAIVE